MGAHLTNGEAPAHKMSNGATSRFLELLLLRSSELAETEWQRRFAVGIAERLDPVRWGYSPACFDVGEIAWSTKDFALEQAFVQKVAAEAKKRPIYKDGDQASERVHGALDAFIGMLQGFTIERVSGEDQWVSDSEPPFAQCKTCSAFESSTGCAICNSNSR